MSDYITLADLRGDLPETFLIEALDDDADGVIDAGAWADVYASTAAAVDAALEAAGIALPLAEPFPAVVTHAARCVALEKLYSRRGVTGEERNPWTTKAAAALKAIQPWAGGSHTAAWGSDTKVEL